MTISRRHVLSASAAASISRVLRAAPLAEFRLGVTSDEIDEDVLAAARFLREFKLGYAEVRSVWSTYNTEQPLDKIREMKSIFDQHQIRTSVLGTAFFKIPLPEDTPQGRGVLDNQWAMLDRGMERAKILGTDALRVFAFMRKQGETPNEKDWGRIFELVSEAARRAKSRGMRLALENVGGSFCSRGEDSAKLLKGIPDSTLGLTWDPNNAGASGEKPFPDGYRLLDPARIFHLHLRDFKHIGGKVEWTAVGEGEFDNLGQLRALRKDGYKGTYTLETHYRSPHGKAHASRTSLTALLKIIEQV
ncbi:MAG: sugar phosphate isomerase/epimerase family protein [Bryobacteraceae bacterium]